MFEVLFVGGLVWLGFLSGILLLCAAGAREDREMGRDE